VLGRSEAGARRLPVQASQWAARPGKPIKVWIEALPGAFVQGVAGDSPGAASLLCQSFLAGSGQAGAGARQSRQGEEAEKGPRSPRDRPPGAGRPASGGSAPGAPVPSPRAVAPAAAAAGQASVRRTRRGTGARINCGAARGTLTADQGGPEHPPGLPMALASGEVNESLRRGPGAKKGGVRESRCGG